MGAGSSKTYTNITPAMFDCVKKNSHDEHGTLYDPADGNTGTATTVVKILLTKHVIVLSFDFEPSTSTLSYVIVQEPTVVTDDEIWDGICKTIKECGGNC